jgi:hypothetical protein
MVAMGRVIKQSWPGAKVVFIGPASLKKRRSMIRRLRRISMPYSFVELEMCFARPALRSGLRKVSPMGRPRVGAHISRRGLLQCGHEGGYHRNQILVTEGKEACTQILNELLEGAIEARFLDLLFCEGCINGPAFPKELSVFSRKELVANYVQERLSQERETRHAADVKKYGRLKLSRAFTAEDHRLPRRAKKSSGDPAKNE